jgi:hypothetical protein
MSEYAEQGRRLVAAAKPRFEGFRVDFEKISNAGCKAAREGRDGLEPEHAGGWFSPARNAAPRDLDRKARLAAPSNLPSLAVNGSP